MSLKDAEFLMFLKECGYTHPRPLPPNEWLAIGNYIYTCAIIKGDMHDRAGFKDRWCYHSYDAAKKALDEWDGVGEPKGWHRNPRTGRRRPDGNATKEYVSW